MKSSCPPVKHINETPANRHLNYSLYSNNRITYRSSCWAWSSWNTWRSFDALDKVEWLSEWGPLLEWEWLSEWGLLLEWGPLFEWGWFVEWIIMVSTCMLTCVVCILRSHMDKWLNSEWKEFWWITWLPQTSIFNNPWLFPDLKSNFLTKP